MQTIANLDFPQDDLDSPDKLLDYLGSHWSSFYGGAGSVLSLLKAQAASRRQQVVQAEETFRAISRHTIDPYLLECFTPLQFRESAVNNAEVAALYYGQAGIKYGPNNGITYQYGTPTTQQNFLVAVPDAAISDIPTISESPVVSKTALISGFDFHIDGDVIVFRNNPFLIPEARIDDIYDSQGQVVDREITLWGLNARKNENSVFRHFGFITRTRPSKNQEQYKQIVNAVLDSMVMGTSIESLSNAVQSITGVPFARGSEVVREIKTRGEITRVFTDKNAYAFHSNSTISCSVGDTLYPGQEISDAVRIYDLRNRVTPANLPGIPVEPGVIKVPSISGSLFFENKLHPVEVLTRSGVTEARIKVFGNAADVEQFWDYVHEQGVSSGKTFGKYLSGQKNLDVEPSADNLPAEINPAKFLIENFLFSNFIIIHVKSTSLFSGSFQPGWFASLRQITPPFTGVLIYVEAELGELIGDASKIQFYEVVPPEEVSATRGTTLSSSVNIGNSIDWLTPENTYVEDGNFSNAFGVAVASKSQALYSRTFGHAVPVDATVVGIEVSVARQANQADIRDDTFRLAESGAAIGDEKATATHWSLNSNRTDVYGGPTDTWGLTLTPARVNDATFGVFMSAYREGGLGAAKIDYVAMTIYYTLPSEIIEAEEDITRFGSNPEEAIPVDLGIAEELSHDVTTSFSALGNLITGC